MVARRPNARDQPSATCHARVCRRSSLRISRMPGVVFLMVCPPDTRSVSSRGYAGVSPVGIRRDALRRRAVAAPDRCNGMGGVRCFRRGLLPGWRSR